MVKLVGNISGPRRAYNLFDELYKRNKGRGSWNKYIQLRCNGKHYSIHTTEKKSEANDIRRQKAL